MYYDFFSFQFEFEYLSKAQLILLQFRFRFLNSLKASTKPKFFPIIEDVTYFSSFSISFV